MSLADWHARLSRVYDNIQSFQLAQLPVIDYETDARQPLPGLRFLREEVKRDGEVLDKFIQEHPNPTVLSTNAPYLIGVWDELVHARQPVAIYRMFSTMVPKERKPLTRTVKVDIVAENGARWVRVNTIKNSRLMMEFREIDSYLTSDEDEDEPRPRLAQTEFDNSVLRMGRDLLAAAKANPVPFPLAPDSNAITPNTMAPQVTIRLTRLNPLEDDSSDPRIGKTIQCLRDMDIDVQLGERSDPPGRKTPKLLEPTTNINLDLSALIALISDISHSPLPCTQEEASARFAPPQSYLVWKRDRAKSLARQSQTTDPFLYDAEDGEDDDDTRENSGQHSRALAAQAVQEMNKGILQEIHERLSVSAVAGLTPGAMFWTTNEARQRCLQIVSKMGGEKERQRADALLGSTLCTRTLPISPNSDPRASGMERKEDAYWKHSRYPAGFLPLAPVHIYPSVLNEDRQSSTSFFDALARTCTGVLLHEVPPVSISSPTPEDVLEEIPPVTQTSLPKLTVHTVRSMLAGASRGYTTLTTNRSSVKAVLKEIQRACGRDGFEPGTGDVEKAALWVLDPRSLSEGMRSK